MKARLGLPMQLALWSLVFAVLIAFAVEDFSGHPATVVVVGIVGWVAVVGRLVWNHLRYDRGAW